jgi:Phage integrase, N-terminal SAM-like domain
MTPAMNEITGSVVARAGKRGTVLYAKVRVGGEQKLIRLGKLWTEAWTSGCPIVAASSGPSTMHDYRGVAKMLRERFGDQTVAGISTHDVKAFREHRLDQGKSARTTNKMLTLLHGVFKLAMERGTASRTP